MATIKDLENIYNDLTEIEVNIIVKDYGDIVKNKLNENKSKLTYLFDTNDFENLQIELNIISKHNKDTFVQISNFYDRCNGYWGKSIINGIEILNYELKKGIYLYFIYYNLHKEFTNKIKQPQQPEDSKHDDVKPNLRNDIFVNKAIELFKHYHFCKSMVNNSRTHFRFLFEVMKKDGLIHDTVSLGQYIKFIAKDFDYVDTELKSINLNSTPNKNNLKDYIGYKEDLKTTLK